MRSYVFLFACLSLIACAWANNLILGQRQSDEIVLQNHPIIKRKIPFAEQHVKFGGVAPKDTVISFVNVTSIVPDMVKVETTAGGIGAPFIELLAVSEKGWAIVMNVVISAKPNN